MKFMMKIMQRRFPTLRLSLSSSYSSQVSPVTAHRGVYRRVTNEVLDKFNDSVV